MRHLCLLPGLSLLILLFTAGAAEREGAVFCAADIHVDSGAERLAAYQVEITYDAATVKIVGVEGGETEGFRDAPRFDERGMKGVRIIVASFVTDDALAAAGQHRVARLHLRVEGGTPKLGVRVMTACKPGGKRIRLEATISRTQPETEQEKGA